MVILKSADDKSKRLALLEDLQHSPVKISYPEGKFCWANEKRFGGMQYCRAHQAAF